MAREDDDDDASLPPIGDGTVDFLAEAKKGKPRNFLLIAKGNKVKYLVVSKKPIKKAKITEAKKLGYKGEAFIGVITGSGQQLVFNLAIADGYESEPCKEKSLKDFLDEHAEFKCLPSFAIVATPPEVPFDDEESSHPLIARFMRLAPLVDKASTARPDQHLEIKQRESTLRALLQDEDTRESSGSKIDEFEVYLNGLITQQPEVVQTPVSGGSDLANKLAEALKRLKPLLEQAVVAHPARKGELIASMTKCAGEIKSQQFDQAKVNIVALGALLKTLLTPDTNASNPQNTASEVMDRLVVVREKLESVRGLGAEKTPTFEKILALTEKQLADGKSSEAKVSLDKLEPALDALLQPLMQFMQLWNDLSARLGEAIKKNPQAAASLNFAYQTALEQAQSGQISVAEQTLQKLVGDIQTAIETAAKTDTERFGIREGIVAEQREKLQSFFEERVKQAKLDAAQEVAAIESAVAELGADEDPKQLAQAIVGALNEMYDEVRETLNSSLESDSHDKVLSTASELRNAIEANPLMQHLQTAKTELGADAALLDRFSDLFTDVEQRVNESMVAS